MLAASAIGITAGMWGQYNPLNAGWYGITASVIFFTVAATVASIFNTIKGPMLKNVYTDNTIFSSKNMNFDTIKALAKVIVAGIPAAFAIPEIINGIMNNGNKEVANQAANWISQIPSINWSIMVPITALIAAWGLYSINHSRLKTEIKANEQNKKSATAQHENPNIFSEEKAKAEATAAKEAIDNAKLAAEEAKQFEDKWNNDIKPLLKPEYKRLFMIYLPYGIVQSIIISQIAGLTLGKAALFITLTGSLVSWLVRKGSKKLIKDGKINEDQLTGVMLPLMAASYIGLFLSPFDLSMTTESIPLLLSILGAYISTPALGTVENTRMMNKTVNYYTNKRAEIEDNTNLTPEEKKTAINKLNKEMSKMTKRASTHYNKGNASALWPVIGLSAIAVLLLGLGNDAEHIPQFSTKYLPMIAEYLGGVNGEDIDTITKLSFFKIFLSVAAGLATATALSNLSLTKSVFYKNKAKISQNMIDNGNITAKDLGIKADEMKTNITEIREDIDNLNTDLTLNRIALSSEETVNKWLQSAISINNRLKFLTTDQDLVNTLKNQTKIFKENIIPNLKYIVENVSPANNIYGLPSGHKISHYSDQFMEQYNTLLTSANSEHLNYVEEGIKQPIKTLHFAKALIYRNGLVSLIESKKHGDVYDGMLKDFQYLYDETLKEIKLYEKDNKINENQDGRIAIFKEQLNILKESFMKNIK